jgi:hypothetical protein
MWYKVNKRFVGTKQVRPWEKVQTFDFQNNWSLNWTAQSVRWTPSYTSWQWWTIGSSSNDTYQSAIMPPSSVYDGNILKSIKIWIYKWVNAYISGDVSAYTVWCWPSNASCSQFAIWENTYYTYTNPSIATVYDGTAHNIVTSGKTWEFVLEYIFNDDGSLILSVDGTEYNLWNYATMFRSLWTNKNLWLTIWRWNTANGQIYVRKVEITTK